MGFLGTRMDGGQGPDRWERWRPTVAMCQQPDFVVDRLVLLHDPHAEGLLATVAADVRQISPETTVEPIAFGVEDPWDFEQMYAALHDLMLAFPFDVERDEYLLQLTTGTHVAQICMFLLAEARYFPGNLLQVSPPRLREGPGRVEVVDLDLSRYDRIARRFQSEQHAATDFLKSGIDTRDATFNRMIDEIERVAIRSRAPVLLTGPTGAGKSQLARRIYELKTQRNQIHGPFVEVNCATLRGDQAMAALFGHTRGAFTGAAGERSGLLRRADGGVLFLDEIAELGRDEQAMILRAIEEGRFLPVGSDIESESDFQLIAGTNRDLRRAVGAGAFREDLLARIDLWTFELPGLASRRDDIEPNLDYELGRFARENGLRATFNKEARARYLGFATSERATWPGNFRDLGASITRMATLAHGGRIALDDVRREIARLERTWHGSESGGDDRLLAALLGEERLAGIDRFDRVQLADVVRVCRATRSLGEAGRTLFSSSRLRKRTSNDTDRLRKYLARYDLDRDSVVASPSG